MYGKNVHSNPFIFDGDVANITTVQLSHLLAIQISKVQFELQKR